jgi:hypothetical protein
MPLTDKGKEIMGAMKRQYGQKKGEQVFYASKNKGKLKGVEKRKRKSIAEEHAMGHRSKRDY